MHATDLMTIEVVTIPPDLSLEAAHQLMLRRSIRHLPVVQGQKLVGLLSDRDVLLAVGRQKDRFVYPPKSAGEAMSLAPYAATRDTPLAELARTMVRGHFDALPIVNGETLVGLVTSTDLLSALALLAGHGPEPKLSFEIRRSSELAARA
jgi:acetoin utilization protein AcuB